MNSDRPRWNDQGGGIPRPNSNNSDRPQWNDQGGGIPRPNSNNMNISQESPFPVQNSGVNGVNGVNGVRGNGTGLQQSVSGAFSLNLNNEARSSTNSASNSQNQSSDNVLSRIQQSRPQLMVGIVDTVPVTITTNTQDGLPARRGRGRKKPAGRGTTPRQPRAKRSPASAQSLNDTIGGSHGSNGSRRTAPTSSMSMGAESPFMEHQFSTSGHSFSELNRIGNGGLSDLRRPPQSRTAALGTSTVPFTGGIFDNSRNTSTAFDSTTPRSEQGWTHSGVPFLNIPSNASGGNAPGFRQDMCFLGADCPRAQGIGGPHPPTYITEAIMNRPQWFSGSPMSPNSNMSHSNSQYSENAMYTTNNQMPSVPPTPIPTPTPTPLHFSPSLTPTPSSTSGHFLGYDNSFRPYDTSSRQLNYSARNHSNHSNHVVPLHDNPHCQHFSDSIPNPYIPNHQSTPPDMHFPMPPQSHHTYVPPNYGQNRSYNLAPQRWSQRGRPPRESRQLQHPYTVQSQRASEEPPFNMVITPGRGVTLRTAAPTSTSTSTSAAVSPPFALQDQAQAAPPPQQLQFTNLHRIAPEEEEEVLEESSTTNSVFNFANVTYSNSIGNCNFGLGIAHNNHLQTRGRTHLGLIPNSNISVHQGDGGDVTFSIPLQMHPTATGGVSQQTPSSSQGRISGSNGGILDGQQQQLPSLPNPNPNHAVHDGHSYYYSMETRPTATASSSASASASAANNTATTQIMNGHSTITTLRVRLGELTLFFPPNQLKDLIRATTIIDAVPYEFIASVEEGIFYTADDVRRVVDNYRGNDDESSQLRANDVLYTREHNDPADVVKRKGILFVRESADSLRKGEPKTIKEIIETSELEIKEYVPNRHRAAGGSDQKNSQGANPTQNVNGQRVHPHAEENGHQQAVEHAEVEYVPHAQIFSVDRQIKIGELNRTGHEHIFGQSGSSGPRAANERMSHPSPASAPHNVEMREEYPNGVSLVDLTRDEYSPVSSGNIILDPLGDPFGNFNSSTDCDDTNNIPANNSDNDSYCLVIDESAELLDNDNESAGPSNQENPELDENSPELMGFGIQGKKAIKTALERLWSENPHDTSPSENEEEDD